MSPLRSSSSTRRWWWRSTRWLFVLAVAPSAFAQNPSTPENSGLTTPSKTAPANGAPTAPGPGTTPGVSPRAKVTLAPDGARRPAEKRFTPSSVQEPLMSMTIQVINEKPGAPSIYRSRHFEFETPVRLGQNAMREICRVFESTNELVRQLPWGIQPMPAGGAPFFKAQLFQTRQDYLASGAPEWSAGVFLRKEQVFRVPFEQVGLIGSGTEWFLKGSINNEVISHEVTHQMMHEYLDYMPVWFAEGTADYVANLPYNGGRFTISNALEGLQRMRARQGSTTREVRGKFVYTKTTRRPHWVAVPELLSFTTSIETPNPIDSVELPPPIKTEVSGTEIRRVGVTPPIRRVTIGPRSEEQEQMQGLADRYYSAHMLVFYFMHLDGDRTGLRIRKYFDAIHEERKRWPVYWQQLEAFTAEATAAKAKYEAEWAAFTKQPGVQDMGDGRVKYPSSLKPPTAPDLKPPAPPDNTDPRKVCAKHLKVLLDGRSPAQLEQEVQDAFRKLKFPLE